MKRIQLVTIIAAILLVTLLVPGVVYAQQGTIYVDTIPTGAEIYATTEPGEANLTVDELIGVTPKQFFLDPGTYTIYLKKYGYGTNWTNLEVTQNTNVVLGGGPIELLPIDPIYGALHISTDPPNATIKLSIRSKAGEKVTYPSEVNGKTPLSLESLTPGMYSFSIEKEGYEDYPGTVNVTAGEVTQLDVPLDAVKRFKTTQFKSMPAGADVLLIGGLPLDVLTSDNVASISGIITRSETVEEAQNQISAILPDINIIISKIGQTPCEMELVNGTYYYLMEKDGYNVVGLNIDKDFTITVGTPPDPYVINETLEKSTEYIDVYFETVENSTEENPPEIRDIVMYVDDKQVGETYGWASLPNPALVDVLFRDLSGEAKEPKVGPIWENQTVPVDTSMFTGRPSKWGVPIRMDRKEYEIIVEAGPHIIITPVPPYRVIGPSTYGYESESYPEFTISTDDNAYQISVISVDGQPDVYPPPYSSVENYKFQNIRMDHTLSALAGLKEWYISVIAGKGGNITPSSCTIKNGDDSPLFNVTPWDGYSIKTFWVDGVSKKTDGWQFFDVTGNHTLKAEFRSDYLTITPLAGPGGNITPNTPVTVPYNGSSGCFYTTPDPGYTLKNATWIPEEEVSESGDIGTSGINDPCNQMAKVTQNWTFYAEFKKLQYLLTAEASEGGTIEPEEAIVDYGDSQTFTMTPDTGQSLVDLTDNSVSVIDQVVDNTYTIDPVTEDHTIYATFSGEEFTITATAGPGGSIDPQGEVKVPYGGDQAFTVTADTAYVISDIIIDGTDHHGPQASPYTHTFTSVTADHTIEAVFSQVVYTITPTAGVGGTIDPATIQQVDAGEDCSFVITADGCHTIGDIIVDGISRGPQISPNTTVFENVMADHTIEAVFHTKTFTITSSVRAPGGGTISPLGVTEVYCNENQTYTMTPNPGNAVLDVIVDGQSVGPVNEYTFYYVNANGHTIEAVFILPPDPDFSANITRVPPNYPVQFYDLTKNNPVAWYWQFGDLQFSNLQEPIHYYTETGFYNVTLTAFNEAAPVSSGGVSVTKNNFIEVTNDPIARFTAEPVGGYTPPGFAVNFTDMSLGGPLIYSWNFGDNSPFSYAKNPIHVYTTPGVYQVTLQVQKPNVGYDYAYETITVLQEPVADFTAHPVSGRYPLQVYFVDESDGFPSSWLWDFGDGQGSFEANPSHVYHTPGLYNITLAIKNYEGEDMITKKEYIEVR